MLVAGGVMVAPVKEPSKGPAASAAKRPEELVASETAVGAAGATGLPVPSMTETVMTAEATPAVSDCGAVSKASPAGVDGETVTDCESPVTPGAEAERVGCRRRCPGNRR